MSLIWWFIWRVEVKGVVSLLFHSLKIKGNEQLWFPRTINSSSSLHYWVARLNKKLRQVRQLLEKERIDSGGAVRKGWGWDEKIIRLRWTSGCLKWNKFHAFTEKWRFCYNFARKFIIKNDKLKKFLFQKHSFVYAKYSHLQLNSELLLDAKTHVISQLFEKFCSKKW